MYVLINCNVFFCRNICPKVCMEHILFYFVYRTIPSHCEIEFSWFIQAFNLFEFMFYKQKQIKRLLDDKYSFFPWCQFFILYTRTISWFASINALIFRYVYVRENFKIFIELIIGKSSFHAHWLFSIILCWLYDIFPSCFPILFMTFAMNIKTKYRIPELLNNKKNYCREQWKKDSHKEHYMQYRSQGTMQKYQLQGKIPTNNILKETGNNRRNTNQREQCKNTTNTQQYKK